MKMIPIIALVFITFIFNDFVARLRVQNYAEGAPHANIWDILHGNVTNGAIKREQNRIYSSFAEREHHRAKLNGRAM